MEAIVKETCDENFGTAYETCKEAAKHEYSIRFQDVRDYFNKRDCNQVKHKPNTCESVVSLGAKYEFELDIMDMESKGAVTNTRYGLVAIDGFSKIAEVVPIKDRTPEAMLIG